MAAIPQPRLIVPDRPYVGQRVGRAVGLPPPGPLDRRVTTEFADQFAFNEAQQARHSDTPVDQIVSKLVQAARFLNITAAPPAHIRPHIWSEPVDKSAQVTIAAGGVATAYQTVCTFTTPPGHWARIEHYGVFNIDPAYDYDGELLWAFRMNGRFLDQGMSDWGEQRGSMVFMRPTVILMNHENITLDFMVKRAVAGGEQVVQMAFRGWTYRLRNNYEGTQGSVTAY